MLKLRILLHGVEKETLELHEGRAYTFGRSTGLDYMLEEHPGISREHFSINNENGTWVVKVLSKFGSVAHAGKAVSEITIEEGTFFRVPPYDFECHFFTPIAEESSDSASPPILAPPVEDDTDVGDRTFVGSAPVTAYIRLTLSAEADEELLRLDGDAWVAGRDEECDIYIRNPKVSRRQFEISRQGNSYFITDLGSANGTLMNGQKLPTRESVPLHSGDVISAFDVTLVFEMRDPEFRNKVVALPPAAPLGPDMYSAPSALIVGDGRGGAIRIDGKSNKTQSMPAKKKIFLAVIVLLGALTYVMFDEPAQQAAPPAASTNISPQEEMFERLPPAQKQNVIDTYQLAKALYMQTKYEVASAQLQKLHELLPDGYKDSKKLAEDCDAAYRNQEQVEYLKREQEKIKHVQQRISDILFKCEKVSHTTSSVEEITNCLSEVTSLDPENAQRSVLIARVQQKVDMQKMKQAEQADYNARVQKHKSIFQNAEAVEKRQDTEATIEAYERVLKSNLPDPGNLKDLAQKRINTIHQTLQTKVETSISAAQKEYDSKNYKAALAKIEEALKIDPQNERAGELNDKARRDLNAILQTLYSDSVLEEGLGKIDSAKEKWRKIVDTDRPEGEYAKRARSKLKTYGNN